MQAVALAANSVAIQQHLFLLPAPSPPYNNETCPGRRINPLLAELFPDLLLVNSLDSVQRASTDVAIFGAEGDEAHENEKDEQSAGADMCQPRDAIKSFLSMPLYQHREQQDCPFRRPGATWAKMLVAQPPITNVGVYRPQYEVIRTPYKHDRTPAKIVKFEGNPLSESKTNDDSRPQTRNEMKNT